VVIRTLEDQLPVDFGSICLHDVADNELIVHCVGLRSEKLAMELALTEHAHVPVGSNGLSRCVKGELMYEPDVSVVTAPLPQRLANGGLRALALAAQQSQLHGALQVAYDDLRQTQQVVMLTGWGQPLASEGDVPAHVHLVLAKPPKLRELREALARCCARN